MPGILAYLIKSFRGGVSDEADKGIAGSFKYGYGLDIHKKKDTLSCQQQMVRETSGDVVTDLPRFFVSCPADGSIYAFGDGGTIYSRSGDGVYTWAARYHDSNGAIKGAYSWTFHDGSTYLVWATDTSMSRKQMWGSNSGMNWTNVTQDWYKLLTPADWHTMEQACGNLMVCNGLYLAMLTYSTAEPVFTTDSLNIRPENITKCLEERDDNVIIGSTRADKDERSYIWSWITTALNWVQKKKIPAAGVNALIYTEYPYLQAGEGGELFYSDFTNVVPLHQIPGGGFTNPGAVCEDENLALFGMSGTSRTCSYPGIWSYGRKVRNRPLVLNYEYRMSPTVTGSTVTEVGGVANINGEILASWKTLEGVNGERHYGVDRVDASNKVTGVYEGLEFDGKNPHIDKYFQHVKLTMEPLVTGCSIALKYKPDRASSWTTALTSSGATSFSTADATEAIFTINQKARVIEIGLTLTPTSNSTPEILSITSYIGKEADEY